MELRMSAQLMLVTRPDDYPARRSSGQVAWVRPRSHRRSTVMPYTSDSALTVRG